MGFYFSYPHQILHAFDWGGGEFQFALGDPWVEPNTDLIWEQFLDRFNFGAVWPGPCGWSALLRLTHPDEHVYTQSWYKKLPSPYKVNLHTPLKYARDLAWLDWGGLQGRVSREGGVERYWMLMQKTANTWLWEDPSVGLLSDWFNDSAVPF